jgi:hypothetical protein
VVIIALDSKDQPQALGSGFAVGEHLLATNFHVIHNASKLKVFTAVSHEELTVTGVKGIDNNRDLALIDDGNIYLHDTLLEFFFGVHRRKNVARIHVRLFTRDKKTVKREIKKMHT